MDYVAPATLEEAYRALEMDEARCLAGGQSLVAMMNLGLVSPARLVSLRRIEALRGMASHFGLPSNWPAVKKRTMSAAEAVALMPSICRRLAPSRSASASVA